MAPLADRIVAKLKVQARALDDDELAAYLGVIRQAVNQACRRWSGRASSSAAWEPTTRS